MPKARTDAPCTHEWLLENFTFDGPDVRMKRGRRRIPQACIGAVAGSLNYNGYRRVSVNCRQVYAHRLAWFAATGVWPTEDIDHIDGNPGNNHISNLRFADRQMNHQNLGGAQKNNTVGVLGVCWSGARKASGRRPTARARLNGKTIHLGTFDTVEEAAEAARAFREAHYAGHTGRTNGALTQVAR